MIPVTHVGSGIDVDVVLGGAGFELMVHAAAELIAGGNVRLAEARALLVQLEEALDQSDLVPLFNGLVTQRSGAGRS